MKWYCLDIFIFSAIFIFKYLNGKEPNGSYIWTPEEEVIFRKLIFKVKDYRELAKRLNRTEDSVLIKLIYYKKELRKEARWKILFCATKFLGVHKRAVITANHPDRLKELGVFSF
jgi:hypothetical protein